MAKPWIRSVLFIQSYLTMENQMLLSADQQKTAAYQKESHQTVNAISNNSFHDDNNMS